MNNNDLRTKTSPSSHAGCMLFLVYLLLQVAFLAQSQEKNTQTPSPSDIPELKGVLHAIPGGGMGIRLGNGTLVKSGQASRIVYKLSFGATQPAGSYSNTVIYVATPTF